jgi:GNAT superfamily N-acetyltransferase
MAPLVGAAAVEHDVRLATAADAGSVASLLAAFRDWYRESDPVDASIRRSVDELLADERTEFLVAGDPAAGIAQIRFRHSLWTGVDDAWLEDLFVLDSARRAGVGLALARASLERARRRGCRRLQLDCNERNLAALALYESLGFASSTPGRWDGGRNLYLSVQLGSDSPPPPDAGASEQDSR